MSAINSRETCLATIISMVVSPFLAPFCKLQNLTHLSDNYTPLPTLRTIPTLPMTVAKKNCPNPIVGTFDTSEIRYWFQVHAQTSKIINFPRPYSAPPGIPIGLNSIHLCKFFNVRIKSYASGIRDDRVEMHLDSWDDTYLFSAGCTWLEVEADDPDFQFGTYSTLDNQIGGQWQQKNSHQVEFARAYSAPPQVVVWLSGFDMRRGKAWKVKTYVSDVTSTGFKIHIDTWEDTVLYSGTATWVAYTAGKPGVCSGSFSTNSIIPKMSHTGYEKFGKGVFGKSPHVVVALNKIDMDCNQFMRLGVKTSDVSVDGMKWKLEGWVDTYITSAGASYISLS